MQVADLEAASGQISECDELGRSGCRHCVGVLGKVLVRGGRTKNVKVLSSLSARGGRVKCAGGRRAKR